MSPAPPAPPKPSNPPPSLDQIEQSSVPQETSSKSSAFPTPKLRLELRDLTDKSTDVFLENFKASKDFAHLVKTVLALLYTVDEPSSRRVASTQPTPTQPTRPTPSDPGVPGTRSVTLIVRDLDGVAYTTGTDLDDDHKEIHLSLSYISHVSAQSSHRTRTELLGVVCHELVHCFQWAAKGTCPGGLIEGIADWVRLRAGFVPPHWKREASGNWDSGYQTTGYFLDWIEDTRGKGSVWKINQKLCDKEYDEDKFWTELFGKDVDTLWKDYGKALEKEKADTAVATPPESDTMGKFGDPDKNMEIRIRQERDS
ncbi:hypothetical protein MBLNU459_g7684t2 [Dothideomycetes sp. NU459]